jgi:transposase InsO family protein
LIDISWIRTETYADNRYWLLVMDEYTNIIWSFFMKTKDETKHHVINLILDLPKDKNIKIKFICCDNSREYEDIQQEIIQIPKIKIQFVFTAPDTPQQNGNIECNFRTLYGKVCSTLNEAKITWPL